MIQDALYKQHTNLPIRERLPTAYDLLTQASGVLMDQQGQVSLEYLEAMAKIRFTLSIVADLLSKQVIEAGRTPESQYYHGAQATHLIQAAKDICTNPHVNQIDITGHSDTTGPIVYLLKLLVRQFGGTPCLQNVVKTHTWVIPPVLRRGEEVSPACSHFPIC